VTSGLLSFFSALGAVARQLAALPRPRFFPFTGVLHRVEVELGNDQQTDPQASLEAALRRQ
jgi:hypothetical protein